MIKFKTGRGKLHSSSFCGQTIISTDNYTLDQNVRLLVHLNLVFYCFLCLSISSDCDKVNFVVFCSNVEICISPHFSSTPRYRGAFRPPRMDPFCAHLFEYRGTVVVRIYSAIGVLKF